MEKFNFKFIIDFRGFVFIELVRARSCCSNSFLFSHFAYIQMNAQEGPVGFEIEIKTKAQRNGNNGQNENTTTQLQKLL